jgi:hypothetical protein
MIPSTSCGVTILQETEIYTTSEAQRTVLVMVVLKISAIFLAIQQLLKSLSIKIMFMWYGKMSYGKWGHIFQGEFR